MARSPYELDKKLSILKDFYSNLGMFFNIDKTKVMIIKSKKDTYAYFVLNSKDLDEVSSYKYI